MSPIAICPAKPTAVHHQHTHDDEERRTYPLVLRTHLVEIRDDVLVFGRCESRLERECRHGMSEWVRRELGHLESRSSLD